MNKTRITRALIALTLALVAGIGALAIVNPAHELRTEIVIDAPPAEVWAVFAATEAYPDWNPFVRELEGELAAGETLQITIDPPEGSAMGFTPEVLVMDSGRELRWLGTAGVPRIFDGEHYFLLEPTDDGRTRFVQGEVFHGVLIPFAGSIFDDTENGFITMNEALRDRVEAGSVATPAQ